MSKELTIERIYALEKAWQKAYDTAKTTEQSVPNEDKVRYWLKVHIAWRIQEEMRRKLEGMVSEYVSENIDRLCSEYPAEIK